MATLTLLLSTLLILPFLVQGSTYGFYSTNSHYYLVVTSTVPVVNVTQATALANAQWLNNKQGYLATINDAGESSYVMSYIASQLAPGDSGAVGWLGAKKSGTSWTWFALTRVSTVFYDQTQGCLTGNNQYCNWAATPPSTAGCAQMYLPSTSGNPVPGKWVGVDCNNAPTFVIIVEFDTPSGTTCSSGFIASGGSCRDVDECAANATICGSGYTCSNTLGSYTCNDVNECAANATLCGSGYSCTNTAGSYSCADINECTATPNVCGGSGYTCTNSPGSYSCADINECTATPSVCGGSGYTCTNTPGAYSCTDINECQASPGPCSSSETCTNTQGSYTCSKQGYYTCTISSTPTTFYIQSVLNGLVVDVASLNAGDALVMNNPSTSSSQQWSLTAEGVFINALTGFAMDVKGTDTAIDTPIIAWYPKPSGSNLNQKWTYDPNTYLVTSAAAANRLLDVRDVNPAVGTPLCLYSPKTMNNLNQQWYLTSQLQPIPAPTSTPTTPAPTTPAPSPSAPAP